MYKGQLTGVPTEIVEKMLYYQEQQGNKRDASVFEGRLSLGAASNGFTWGRTPEGEGFWREVLNYKQYSIFFDKYPKTQYPKVMWVRDFSKSMAVSRVVFMEKCGKYLAWANATTIEEAEKEMGIVSWDYAEDIEPPTPPKKMTVAEITQQLGYEIEIVK